MASSQTSLAITGASGSSAAPPIAPSTPSLDTNTPSNSLASPSAPSSSPSWSSGSGTASLSSYLSGSGSVGALPTSDGGSDLSTVFATSEYYASDYTEPSPTSTDAYATLSQSAALSSSPDVQPASASVHSSLTASAEEGRFSAYPSTLDASPINVPSLFSTYLSSSYTSSTSSSSTLRRSHSKASRTAVDIEALPSGSSTGHLEPTQFVATTQVFTTTYRSTLASSSGTARHQTIVDVTQMSTRTVATPVEAVTNTYSSAVVTGKVDTEVKHDSNTLLVAILVPVLVTLLVLLPCFILVVRLRRRRRVRFMPDYGIAGNPPGYPHAVRRPSIASTAITHEGIRYDMCSVLSASMVHTGLQDRTRASESQAPSAPALDPFADGDDVRAPLFIETNVPRGSLHQSGSTASPASSRASSRWASFSPTASFAESLHRVRSRLSTRSSSHDSFRAQPEVRVHPLAPKLFADKAQIQSADDPFSDADWHMDDDPFANLSAPSEESGSPVGHGGKGSSGHAYTSLLRKIGRKS